MGMWWRAVADVLRRGGGFQGGITHTQTYTQPLLCQRLGDTMSPTAIVGPAWVAPGLLCVSVCVCVCACVCHTKGVPAWAAICHPPSQGEERGGGDPWPLNPPVGPFSQSHAGRAPCLKSHGCLSGFRMEGGGWACAYMCLCVCVCVCVGGGVPL